VARAEDRRHDNQRQENFSERFAEQNYPTSFFYQSHEIFTPIAHDLRKMLGSTSGFQDIYREKLPAFHQQFALNDAPEWKCP
jgi:hypothetical protein